MSPTLAWAREGLQWPHREASRFVEAGGLRWHVQQMGAGPVALLIHGTGASTHSWRGLMPLLAPHFTVVAMDLPGHAFTDTPPASQLSLPGIASAVAALVRKLGLEPDLVVGHSAGAAIAARVLLDGTLAARTLVAINGAFLPLAGLPGLLFPPVARLMAATPLASQLFARRTWDRAAVEKLIGGTGSALDLPGLALYGMLVRDARHAAGALGMMARWDLRPLVRDFARLQVPLTLVVGADDRAVPPGDSRRVAAMFPASGRVTVETVRGAGHLVHEEQPEQVAQCVLKAHARTTRAGVMP